MATKILSIDPSGTGTTGIFTMIISSSKKFSFWEYQNKDWEKHLEFILGIIEEFRPNIVLFENTNYVYGRQQQGTVSLCKLIGAIASFKHTINFIQKIDGVLVNTVKSFRDKVQTGTEEIENLVFQEGRGHGWKYQEQRISKHLVDAIVVYHLWTKEHLKTKEEIREQINELKKKKRLGVKQKEKLIDLEKELRERKNKTNI